MDKFINRNMRIKSNLYRKKKILKKTFLSISDLEKLRETLYGIE